MEDRGSALTLVLRDSELVVFQEAILARIHELESRKRLPRGSSVRDVRTAIDVLESIASVVGRDRTRRGRLANQLLPGIEAAAIPHSADCHGGNGVSIGPKVPADPSIELE